ncbi:MAG: hypothetical protein M5U12_29685 [Verrucomicrobia bacterium]|nr:hypothetical protein [Verrucomicrobiota bacterium]
MIVKPIHHVERGIAAEHLKALEVAHGPAGPEEFEVDFRVEVREGRAPHPRPARRGEGRLGEESGAPFDDEVDLPEAMPVRGRVGGRQHPRLCQEGDDEGDLFHGGAVVVPDRVTRRGPLPARGRSEQP